MLDKRVKLPIWSYRRLIAWSICAMVMPAMWTAAQAEVTEVHLAKQYGLAYLPLMIMEHQKLLEKQAKAMGLGNVTVTWNTFGGGSVMNDALLSGRLDFASGAVTSLAVLWSKTRGNVDVRGVAAMNSMPFLLNTRNPKIKTIRDFTDADKIALPAVRISPQALVLEIAAAKAFGETNYNRLDRLTVSMSHPQAMLAMLSGKGGIDAHFGSPPFQYEELGHTGIHTVLNSYQVFGGKSSFAVIWASNRFRKANPKTFHAFLAALKEAISVINHDKHAASAFYVKATRGKEPVGAIYKMITNPDVEYTMTPENTMQFIDYMYKFKTIQIKPASWKDLFFPEIHDLPGS